MAGIPRCSRAAAPQTEMMSPRPERETNQEARVAAAPVVVEVRCGGAYPDELHVHVQLVADAEHVAEQTTVLVDSVRLRLPIKANERPGGKECDEGGPPAESCSARPRETKGGPTQCCTPDWISAASVSISACSISWARRSRSALRRPTLTVFAALLVALLVSPSRCGRRSSR